LENCEIEWNKFAVLAAMGYWGEWARKITFSIYQNDFLLLFLSGAEYRVMTLL